MRVPLSALGVLCSVLFLSGCLSMKMPTAQGDSKWGVNLTWHGHSAFTLTDSVGRTIVIDPYDDTVGYGLFREKADVLLISHGHFDHNYNRGVKAKRRDIDLVSSTGTHTVAGGLSVLAVEADHDAEGGEINGKTLLFVFRLGGLKIAHLGDFGQEKLTPYQKSVLASLDVLMIPVGGKTTIGPKKARAIVEELSPKLVVPMHFGDPRFFRFAPLSDFTSLFPKNALQEENKSSAQIKFEDLPVGPSVLILRPSARDI